METGNFEKKSGNVSEANGSQPEGVMDLENTHSMFIISGSNSDPTHSVFRYVYTPSEWITETRLHANELRILLFLAMFRGTCHPSLWQIQDGVGLSRGTVKQALRDMKAMGILSWKKGGYGQGSIPNKANVYTIRGYSDWDLSIRSKKTSGKKDQAGHYTKEPAKRGGAPERAFSPSTDAIQEGPTEEVHTL